MAETACDEGTVIDHLHPPALSEPRTAPSEAPAGAAPSAVAQLGAGVVQRKIARRIQRRAAEQAGDDSKSVHEAASHGLQGPAQPLPHLDAIQRSFGPHDVSGVCAHVGGPAAEASASMGALAYATGNDVAFATAPDLHTAAHEAAHVVQQRAGVSLKSGVGEAGDPYERHADAVADKVVRGESAESLLDEMAGGGGGGKAVQRVAAPGVADEATEEEAPPTTESPEALLAEAIDSGHDPDRSSGEVGGDLGAGEGATGADAAQATATPGAAPAGAAPIQRKALARLEPQQVRATRAVQMKAATTKECKTDPKSIVKDYVVSKDAARAVPDVGSDVYKASQALSRATCGSDGDPPGMVDIAGGLKIHQDVKEPLANMLAAAAAQTGKKGAVKIKDALRSLPQQWEIWKNLGLYGLNGGNAAIPGTSNHGTGRAVDLKGDLSWVAQHGGEHGFVNFAGENWHFDHLSSAGVRGRKFKEGASRKRSGQGTSAITAQEAAQLQNAYDDAVKSWNEGKTPGSPGGPPVPGAGTAGTPATGTAGTPAVTSTATAAGTPAAAGAPAAAPKAPAAPAAPAVDPNAGLPALVGTTVTDNGGYVFVLESDLNFKVTGAPPVHAKAIGKIIKKDDPKLAKSWQSLATKIQAEHPAPAPAPAPAAPASDARPAFQK